MARSIALVCFAVGAMCSLASAEAGGENRGRLVNAVYVFGDSLVDVGNNDYLPAPASRANRPYGMDLPGRPTGRFTNGYNLADVISQRLGFDMSPKPYLSMLSDDKILLGLCKIGANYASGGSGILDTTGKGTLTMRTQIKYFKKAADNMICYPSKEEHLARSLFLLSGGGNDFSAFDPSTASPQAGHHLHRAHPGALRHGSPDGGDPRCATGRVHAGAQGRHAQRRVQRAGQLPGAGFQWPPKGQARGGRQGLHEGAQVLHRRQLQHPRRHDGQLARSRAEAREDGVLWVREAQRGGDVQPPRYDGVPRRRARRLHVLGHAPPHARHYRARCRRPLLRQQRPQVRRARQLRHAGHGPERISRDQDGRR